MKVTFLSDDPFFGGDDADTAEREAVEWELHDMGLKFETPIKHVHRIDQVGTPDLLVLDYGGMSSSGAHDVSMWHIKSALRWADDNPGRLMLVWTQHTQWLYEEAIEDFRDGLDNIVPYFRETLSEPDPAVVDKIKSWFGV